MTRRQDYDNYRPRQSYNSYSSSAPQAKKVKKPKHRGLKFLLALILLSIGYVVAIDHVNGSATTSYTPPIIPNVKAAPAPKPATNHCAGNVSSEEVVVSISKQRMWACQYSNSVFTSLVITGYTKYASDITPLGTYTIYYKQTNLNLRGTDGIVTWNDHVSYWMPFLSNKYGVYGIHDATWVPNSLFGHVNINTDYHDSSHGCVELPLSAAKWVYNWVHVGTHVVIKE